MSRSGSSPGQTVLDQRNALYVAAQRVVGRLDALDPFGDGSPVECSDIADIRQWLSAEVERILPAGDAFVEEVADPYGSGSAGDLVDRMVDRQRRVDGEWERGR